MLKRLLMGLIILSLAGSLFAFPRKILYEKFTAEWCGPCATAAPVFRAFIEDHIDDVAVVTYHSSSDPWHDINSTYHETRFTYYGVTGIPDCYADGGTGFHPGVEAYLNNSFNDRIDVESPVSIEIEAAFDGDGINAIATVTSADEAVEGNVRIHFKLVSNHWDLYTGSNGLSEYHHDLVDSQPDQFGLPFEIETNTTDEYEVDFDWPFLLGVHELGIDNVSVVVFIQDNTTGEVLQSEMNEINVEVPMLAYNDVSFTDDQEWRENNRPDAGETVNMIVSLQALEIYQPAYNITATLTCADESIVINDDYGAWPDLEPGNTADNADDFFTISIPEEYIPQYVDFTLDVTADDFNRMIEFQALLGVPDVLLVNDYGEATNEADFWHSIFDDAGFVADISDELDDIPSLDDYGYVIWATGESSLEGWLLTEDEITQITTYLDNGGNLVFSSQYAGDVHGDDLWFQEYFAVNHDVDAVMGPAAVGAEGITDGPFPDTEILWIGFGGANNCVSPSSMVATDAATPFLHYHNVADIAAVGHKADGYNAIYLGFPLEAINGGAGTTTAGEMVNLFLDWLENPWFVDVEDTKVALPAALELSSHPNPFNATLNINYSLPSSGQVKLEVMNILGERVALLENGRYSAGSYESTWSADNFASGVYLLRLTTSSAVTHSKVLLLK